MPRVREEREVVGEEEGVLMLSEQVELGVVMAGEKTVLLQLQQRWRGKRCCEEW